ncbi:MAG: ParB/RepB/Spo0J family partition protein [Candidatus Paceibacterota bacterium]
MNQQPLPQAEPVFLVETDKIVANPYQPRRHFDEEKLKDLANSIRELGILQPLVVTKVEEDSPQGLAIRYELIAGERRLPCISHAWACSCASYCEERETRSAPP